MGCCSQQCSEVSVRWGPPNSAFWSLEPVSSPKSRSMDTCCGDVFVFSSLRNHVFIFLMFIFMHLFGRAEFLLLGGLSLVVASGNYCLLWCMSFSLRWLL